MASNKAKAILLTASFLVAMMGAETLAIEGKRQNEQIGITTEMPAFPQTIQLNNTIPTFSNREIDLTVKPFSYTPPEIGSIVLSEGMPAAASDAASQITTLDVSAISVAPIDMQMPASSAPAVTALNLNLAPIPKALNPPPVNINPIKPVTSSKSSK